MCVLDDDSSKKPPSFSMLQPISGLSSGVLTPTVGDMRALSPDAPEMNDLVSALRNISASEEPVEEQATKVSLKVWPFCPRSHVCDTMSFRHQLVVKC